MKLDLLAQEFYGQERFEEQIVNVLKLLGKASKLKVLRTLDNQAKADDSKRPTRAQVWNTLDKLLQKGLIEKLPIDHNSLYWEREFKLT